MKKIIPLFILVVLVLVSMNLIVKDSDSETSSVFVQEVSMAMNGATTFVLVVFMMIGSVVMAFVALPMKAKFFETYFLGGLFWLFSFIASVYIDHCLGFWSTLSLAWIPALVIRFLVSIKMKKNHNFLMLKLNNKLDELDPSGVFRKRYQDQQLLASALLDAGILDKKEYLELVALICSTKNATRPPL